MKKKARLKYLALLLTLTCMLSVQACKSDDFAKTSYRTLSIAGITYDTAMRISADAYKQGIINDAAKEKIITVGNIYYQSYMTARQGLEVYYKALVSDKPAEKTQLVSDFAKMVSDLKQLVELVKSSTKKEVVTDELPIATEVQAILAGGNAK